MLSQVIPSGNSTADYNKINITVAVIQEDDFKEIVVSMQDTVDKSTEHTSRTLIKKVGYRATRGSTGQTRLITKPPCERTSCN